ncbi:MAG: hypothetical protein ACYTET_07375 [Planctomycetota bacterium]
MKKDPDQLTNLADDQKYAKVKDKLSTQLMSKLKDTADPRALGTGDIFDQYPYRAKYKLNN